MCRFKGAIDRTEGQVTMGYLQEGKKGLFPSLGLFTQGQAPTPPSELAKQADLFMAVNITSVDLPPLEKYVGEYLQGRPMILWNLELDSLRSDLGECLAACAPVPASQAPVCCVAGTQSRRLPDAV